MNYGILGAILIIGGVVYYMNIQPPDSNPQAYPRGGYPDIDPANQGGLFYSKKWDDYFYNASNKVSVPFALLKAHAIAESSLNDKAYHYDNGSSGASFGLMQLEFKPGSDKWSKYGYPASSLDDGSPLYDPGLNTFLGASLIQDNLIATGNLRDAINMYNTGVREGVRAAPGGYVDKVLKYYSTIVGQKVG